MIFPLRLQSQPNYRERNFEFQFQGQIEGQALDITSQIIPPPPSQFILNLKGLAIKIGNFIWRRLLLSGEAMQIQEDGPWQMMKDERMYE